MAHASYYERESIFYGLRNDLDKILGHPDFEAPDHPYLPVLSDMSKHAALGIIDTSNGVLHLHDSFFHDAVVIAPVLEKDLRTGSVSVCDELLRDKKQDDMFDYSSLDPAGGICIAGVNIKLPIVGVAPYMNTRHWLVRGLTYLHELDHAYWWLRRNKRFRQYNFDPEDDACIAAQEISANRLERQALLAHMPAEYEQELAFIERKYADNDFERLLMLRQSDKLKKTIQVCAFINYMFDALGAEVGTVPSAEVVAAMKAQQLM